MVSGNFGGGGESAYPVRSGIGPDYYHQDGRYSHEWQDERRGMQGGGEMGPQRPINIQSQYARVASVPPDRHSMGAYPGQYGPERTRNFYTPQDTYSVSFRPPALHGPVPSTEYRGVPYLNPTSIRQAEGPDANQLGYTQGQYPPSQHQLGHNAGTSQQYQDNSYHHNDTPARPTDPTPVHPMYGGTYHHESQPRLASTTSYQGESPHPKHNTSDTELARSDPFYQESQDDFNPPQPTARTSSLRQQSASSDASSSSDLTLMQQLSTPTLIRNETLIEEEVQEKDEDAKEPLQTKLDFNSDPNLDEPAQPDDEGPQTLDSVHDGYVMVSEGEETEEEEEEEEPDGREMLKPYVKFNERFPSELSWYDIGT